MERIFKIKTRSNPDPRDLYPSERRYSASIVFGLSVVFSQLFLYSVLMGSLIVHRISMQETEFNITEAENVTLIDTEDLIVNSHLEEFVSSNESDVDFNRMERRVEKDLFSKGDVIHYNVNIPVLVCTGCFVMAFGTFFCAITGILAWKRWYMDHNITFFFLSSCFSSLTSSICLMLSLLTSLSFNYESFSEHSENVQGSPLSFSLSINILILSILVVIWSILSTKLAFRGMKNNYPDDLIISKRGGCVEVNTVTKGSKNCRIMPPDILNHFPAGEKLAKYLPKKDNSNLPKAESNYEYQQRVDKFLAGNPEENEK